VIIIACRAAVCTLTNEVTEALDAVVEGNVQIGRIASPTSGIATPTTPARPPAVNRDREPGTGPDMASS
jgi:hypothetical protein